MFPPQHHARRRTTIAAFTTALAVTLAACSSTDSDDSSPADGNHEASASAYPLTVEDARGDVTIKEAPERILVFEKFQILEVAEELGLLEKVITFIPFHGLTDTGNWAPSEIFGDFQPGGSKTGDDLREDPESVARLEPDLIFAPSSMSPDLIDTLDDIAPTVTTADGSDSDESVIRSAFAALGGSQDQEENFISDARSKLQEYGKETLRGEDISAETIFPREDVLAVPDFGSSLIYETGIRRGKIQQEVHETGDFQEVSWENTGLLDSDIFLLFGPDPEKVRETVESKGNLWLDLPAVKDNLVYYLFDPSLKKCGHSPLTPHGAQHFIDNCGFILEEAVAAVDS